jgi:hypothetical protein
VVTVHDRSNDSVLDRLVREPSSRLDQVLLRGGYVLTMDPAHGDFVGDVLIRGDVIEAVGQELSADDSLVVDVSGQIVLPGLIDSHVHAWEGAIRGIAPGADSGNYMAITHGCPGAQRGRDDDWTTATTRVRRRIRMRRSLRCARWASVRCMPSARRRSGEVGRQLPGDLLRLREAYFSSADQLLTMRMFDMTPSVETWTFAAEHGFNIVAEMGMWIEDLDALLASGLSREGHTYNHCAGLTEEQWRRIADSGAQINMVPRSDSQFGLGAFIPILDASRHPELCRG